MGIWTAIKSAARAKAESIIDRIAIRSPAYRELRSERDVALAESARWYQLWSGEKDMRKQEEVKRIELMMGARTANKRMREERAREWRASEKSREHLLDSISYHLNSFIRIRDGARKACKRLREERGAAKLNANYWLGEFMPELRERGDSK